MTNTQRSIYSSINAVDYFPLNNYNIELKVYHKVLKLKSEGYAAEEIIFPYNLRDFLLTFKENTMLIFNAVLTNHKIMFIGDSQTSCETLCRFVFSLLALFRIYNFAIFKRVFPYKNLNDLDFLNTPNAIYAVTNPIFKNQRYWDIMCEVNNGQITLGDSFKIKMNSLNRESDILFIRELLFRLKTDYLTDYEIIRYFTLYNHHIFKLAGNDFIDKQSEEVNV